jgi:Predicted AAA-ATPase
VTQKYPIGIQEFKKLREGDFFYVDKTPYLHSLVNSAGYYFLSRPRRFGKSLFVNTIEALFQGKKDLFKGLFIEDKWNWEQTNSPLAPICNRGGNGKATVSQHTNNH